MEKALATRIDYRKARSEEFTCKECKHFSQGGCEMLSTVLGSPVAVNESFNCQFYNSK